MVVIIDRREEVDKAGEVGDRRGHRRDGSVRIPLPCSLPGGLVLVPAGSPGRFAPCAVDHLALLP